MSKWKSDKLGMLRIIFYGIFFAFLVFYVFSFRLGVPLIRADDFGINNDAYYCKFIPAIGIFLGKKTSLPIDYDSNKVKGIRSEKISEYTIKDLADIYVGNPHRFNKALNIAGPPGQEVVWAFWGYNYSSHLIKTWKLFIPLSENQNDLTKILEFELNNDLVIRNESVYYTILDKIYFRKAKFLVYKYPLRFNPNQFGTGRLIAASKIRMPVEVIFHETSCNITQGGGQEVKAVLCFKNLEPIKQKLEIEGTIYYLSSMGTHCITISRAVSKGVESISKFNIRIKVLSDFKVCINMPSTGLNPNPVTKNVFVLRDDLSYNNNWRGIQPGFSVPRSDSGRVLCVTRIPYSFTINTNACKFPVGINIDLKIEDCLRIGNLNSISLRLKNKGIKLTNLNLKMNFVDKSGNIIDIGYFVYDDKRDSSLKFNTPVINSFVAKEYAFDFYMNLVGKFTKDIYLQTEADNEAIHCVTRKKIKVCPVIFDSLLSVSACKETERIKYQFMYTLKLPQAVRVNLKNFNFDFYLFRIFEGSAVRLNIDKLKGYVSLQDGNSLELSCFRNKDKFFCFSETIIQKLIGIKEIVLQGSGSFSGKTKRDEMYFTGVMDIRGYPLKAKASSSVTQCYSSAVKDASVTKPTPVLFKEQEISNKNKYANDLVVGKSGLFFQDVVIKGNKNNANLNKASSPQINRGVQGAKKEQKVENYSAKHSVASPRKVLMVFYLLVNVWFVLLVLIISIIFYRNLFMRYNTSASKNT